MRVSQHHQEAAKDRCNTCGRSTSKVDENRSVPDTSIEPGSWVQLSPDFKKFHDAKFGPLQQPGGDELPQIGKVLKVEEYVPGVGSRCLVTAVRPCKGGCGY